MSMREVSMNEPLRPSSLGEILDRTAQLYRSHFLVFLGISIVPTGVIVALVCVFGGVAAWWGEAGAHTVSADVGYALVGLFCVGLVLLALPILVVVTGLATAAMSHAVSEFHLGGKTTIRGAYKSIWRRGWRYIWLYLLRRIIVWVAPIALWFGLLVLFGVGAALAQKAGMGDLTNGALFALTVGISTLVLLGYVVWTATRLSLAFPAAVIEQAGAVSSIRRSYGLSEGSKGRIVLLYLLGAALSWLLSVAVMFPLTIALYLIPGMNNPQHAKLAGVVMLLIVYGSSFAVQALVEPVYGTALVLFYYDQRIRKEGYDIELLMQQAGMVMPVAKTETAVPVAAPWLAAVPFRPEAAAVEPPQATALLQSTEATTEATGEPQ